MASIEPAVHWKTNMEPEKGRFNFRIGVHGFRVLQKLKAHTGGHRKSPSSMRSTGQG